MLDLISSTHRCSLALVKLRSRLLTRLELAAVDGHQRFGEQTERLAQHHELPADTTNGVAIVLAEVGDGLEVRCQAPGQPHQLDVALCLTFKAATRLNPVEVTVDIDLQQDGRVIYRAASFGGNHTTEAQSAEIEFINEHIDHSNRIGIHDVIIQAAQAATCIDLGARLE